MNGRITRARYFEKWLVYFSIFGSFFLAGYPIVATAFLGGISFVVDYLKWILLIEAVVWLLWTILLVPVWVKRFHDLGFSGSRAWLLLIPFYNLYLFAILFFKKGSVGANQYGEDPYLGPESGVRLSRIIFASTLLFLIVGSGIWLRVAAQKKVINRYRSELQFLQKVSVTDNSGSSTFSISAADSLLVQSWPIYENRKYGYRIRYDPVLKPTACPQRIAPYGGDFCKDVTGNDETIAFFDPKYAKEDHTAFNGFVRLDTVRISHENNVDGVTLENFVNQSVAAYRLVGAIASSTPLKINGGTAILEQYRGGDGRLYKVLYFEHNGQIFTLDFGATVGGVDISNRFYEDALQTFGRMIGTLEFL